MGVTHAGTKTVGTIKNSIGIGTLLEEGIGATLRVSLTAPLEEEVKVGWNILEALDLRKRGPKLITCPTCGRTEIDLMTLAEEVEKELQKIKKPITVAVMGCVVNGPGEAKEADAGIAGGRGKGAVFSKGKIIKTVPEEELLPALLEEIKRLEK